MKTKTFQRFIAIALRGGAAAAVAALVLAGCATVDLTPEVDAPPVRMPGDAPVRTVSPDDPEPQYTPPAPPLPAEPDSVSAQPLPPPDSAAGGADASSDASGVDAHLITLTTRLDGVSAVPSTSSSAAAQIDLIYDTGTRLLRWKVQWAGFSSPITGVSFYGPATQGQQGPPTLIWPAPFGSHYEGRATLTPQQATDLMGGLWYVNISTINYPGGEIRGQVRVVY